MAWKLQSIIWMFLPAHRDVNMTACLFLLLILISFVMYAVGIISRRKCLARRALQSVICLLVIWAATYPLRPTWLKVVIPGASLSVTSTPIRWQTVASGMEVADVIIYANDQCVDQMKLVRINPQIYAFNVHWNGDQPKTAELWQKELMSQVVISGSYFGNDFTPLTPIRSQGVTHGPKHYASSHGAFVIKGHFVDIIDLKGQDTDKIISHYPDAIVSYPLLIDSQGINRATESGDWLASRNFVAIDQNGLVILGATETGFFSIKRLGDFLKSSSLNLRVALNMDGGPLVSQVIQTATYSRFFHGKAEISDGYDTIRARWYEVYPTEWPLPIVISATAPKP